MRIGTWNLECGGRTEAVAARQRERLRKAGADVMVLTEPGPEVSTASPDRVPPGLARSLPRGASSWVAVEGAVELGQPAPWSRMAVTAKLVVCGEQVIVYGAVLPWRGICGHHPELMLPGETSSDAFARVLGEQLADVRALVEQNPGVLVVWAGDFNQTITGPNDGGSARARDLLRQALDSLGFVAWNEGAEHASPGMCAIDLVCGPQERKIVGVTRIPPERESDHAGYVVEIV